MQLIRNLTEEEFKFIKSKKSMFHCSKYPGYYGVESYKDKLDKFEKENLDKINSILKEVIQGFVSFTWFKNHDDIRIQYEWSRHPYFIGIGDVALSELKVDYSSYIERHKDLVAECWRKIKKAFKENGVQYIDGKDNKLIEFVTEEFINSHDYDLYNESIYDIMAKAFEEGKENLTVEELIELEEAEKQHMNNNMYHWQMLKKYANIDEQIVEHTIEMICDWYATSMENNEDYRDFYSKNKDEMDLPEVQTKIIEKIYNTLEM